MPLSSSMTLNALPPLSSLPGEQTTGSNRSAQSDSSEGDNYFEDYLDQEIGGQTLESQWLQAVQIQNFLPNFMLAIPSLLSVWPLDSASGPGAEVGGDVTGESDTAATAARSGPSATTGRESSNPSIEKASAAKPGASQSPEESRPVEQNRELDQEKSRPAEQKSQSNQTDRTETASNREPKEAENSQKSGAGETASSAKKTESSKESSADKVSFASGETEAGEGTDSLSGEMAFDADISGENEEGEQPNMEMRKAALNGHAAQGGTAPQVPTQHAGGGPQAAGNVGRVEGASAAGKVSAIAETGKAGSTHGSNGSNSSPLHGQAAQPSGAAPAGAAPGTSAINGNAPSGKASEAASAERPLPSQVPEQILKSLHRAILNGDREIQIRLDPPELGSLRLNLSQDDDGLRIVIETSSEAARQALDAALPDLRRMLQEEDVHVQDFIVQAWNEEKPSDHEGWHGSYQGEYGDSGGGLSGEDEAMPGAQQAQGVSGIFNDHRVNMVA